MKLHMRGVELVVELLEAADNIERMSVVDTKQLLGETAAVLGELLARDIPPESSAQNSN